MKSRKLIALVAASVLLVFAAFGLRLTPLTHAQSSATAPAQVTVDNFTFGPSSLTVAANSTVTWVNKDDVPHVIASDAGLFKSKALDTDDKYSYTFNKPGTYSYYCSVHPKMVGKIVVQ